VEPSLPSLKKRARRSTTISGKHVLSQQAGHESNVEGEQAGTWDAKPTNIEKRTNWHRKKNSPPKSNIKNLADIQAQHRKDHTGNWSKAFSLRAKNLSNLVHNILLASWEYAQGYWGQLTFPSSNAKISSTGVGWDFVKNLEILLSGNNFIVHILLWK
jgi:hypothetical protein